MGAKVSSAAVYEVEGVYHVSQALWRKIRSVAGDPDTADSIEQMLELKEAMLDVIPDFADHIIKGAMKSVMQPHVIQSIVEVGKVLPWVGSVVNFAAVIFMGVWDVYENKENFKKLNEFISAVLATLAEAPKEQLERFFQANDDINKQISNKFEGYMAKGVQLVERFTHRSKLWAFVMRGRDEYDFQMIQQGLNSTLTLILLKLQMMPPIEQQQTTVIQINLNSNYDQIQQKIKQLGKGDYEQGWNILSEYLNDLDADQNKTADEILQLMSQKAPEGYEYTGSYDKRLEMQERVKQLGDGDFKKGQRIFQQKLKKKDNVEVQEILKLMPYSSANQVTIPPQAAALMRRMVNKLLPEKLSLELNQFWIDNFGYISQVSWREFVDTVEMVYKPFLSSEEVVAKEREYDVELTKYILRYKLDKDQDGQITGSELRTLYVWCMDTWEAEAKEVRGPKPLTMEDILRCLLRNISDVITIIKNNWTLDLREQGIFADSVEQKIFEKHEDKLGIYRVMLLNKNPIGDVGAREVFRQISCKMPNLQHLEIEDCRLGDELSGISTIIPQVQILSLADNEIGDRGMDFISKGFESEKVSLKRLDLQDNKISDNGLEKLALAIANNSNVILEELYLNENNNTEQSDPYIDILMERDIAIF